MLSVSYGDISATSVSLMLKMLWKNIGIGKSKYCENWRDVMLKISVEFSCPSGSFPPPVIHQSSSDNLTPLA